MRRFGKLLGALAAAFALVLAAAAVALPARVALATTGEPYTYQVRIWGGNHGTVQGQECATVYATVAYDTPVPLDRGWVELNADDGGKYYVKGFRKAGTDNLDGVLETATPHITEDSDFVVVYGVSKELVSYTVSFVEYGTGKALANDQGETSKTYYGNLGDETVVAFDYIAGYRPRYRNIKKTLGAEGTNNLVFEYIPLAEGETEDGGTTSGGGAGGETETTTTTYTTTVVEEGGAGGNGGAGGAGGSDEAGAGDEAGGEDAGEDEAGAGSEVVGGGAADDEAESNEPPATEEILDMDNPLAGPDAGGDASDEVLATDGASDDGAAAGPSRGLLIGGGVALALLLGALWFLWYRKKKDADNEPDNSDE